ncbi:V-type proton ATPase subunit S1-like isoform X1 [Anguilla rostrata]|uniref:V-type proton ATPase subunit S1-like isoform X1 n=1 Tax=Anguilla rostrata TaxID=7938 RepID=UPI0030CCEAF7
MAVSCVSTAPVVMAFLLFLSAILSTGSCGGQVPLVLWSSEGHPVPRQTPPPAGHVVSAAELDSYLSSVLAATPRNTLLFLQDELSVDDFTVFGGVFGNKEDSVFPHLESALKASSSPLVLPALSWGGSSAVLPLLQQHLGTPPLYLDPPSLTHLRLNASVAALLVIRLPYKAGSGPESSRDALSGNDAVIGQVLDIMKAQAVPYTAIYTAFKPSRQVAEDLSEGVQSVGRSLLQAPAGTLAPLQYSVNGTACILLWAESLEVSVFNKTWQTYDLAPETFSTSLNVTNPNVTLANSTCGATQAESRLVLNYANILGFRKFSLTFTMSRRFYPVSAREWFTLDAVELEYDGQTAFFNGSRDLNAPAEYSYHCASVTSFSHALLVPFDPTESGQWRLSFTDFQIQGFSVAGPRFSYASDCASFFTPGIWMGLIVTLLMLLILTYGLHMITQLRTMDRFDDPKGPAISVPLNE